METEKVVSGLNWWAEAIISRRAQFSDVILFRTLDPKRVEQFMDYLAQDSEVSAVYVFFIWRGLFKVEFSSGKVAYIPITADVLGTTQPVRELGQALDFMDGIFRREKNVVFIMHGLFQKSELLISAIRSFIFDMELYEKGHTVVIFSESPEVLFDDETLKYLIVQNVPKSTKEERETLLRQIAQSLQLKYENGMADITAGLNLHELESVALKSIYKFRELRKEVLQEYKHEIIKKSGILDIEEPSHGFEAVGGYEVLKNFIKDNVIKVIKNPSKAEKLGLRPPRGILLFGMGGTGKTHFARALAKEVGLPFLRLRTEKIVSKWYGETEQRMAKVLELAEEVAPCILFIDEIDRFGQRGGISEHEASRRTFSILLEWLGDERRKTIVIGTTNRPQDLDEAFIRVGRFDYIIPVLLPDKEARKEILRVQTSVVRKVPLAKDVNLDELAEKTEMFTGAELAELVLRAARNALKMDKSKVSAEDFEVALRTFKISREARSKQLEEFKALAERFCNDSEFLEQIFRGSEVSSRLDLVKRGLQ